MSKTDLLCILVVIAGALFAGLYIQGLSESRQNYRCVLSYELAGRKLCYMIAEYSGGYDAIAGAGKASCSRMSFSGSSGILCSPDTEGSVPAVVAVGGWGSTAESAQGVCNYFASKGWMCLSVASAGDARSEEQVVSEIHKAVNTLKAMPNVDNKRIILWGGSNGAYTTLIAASERSDIFAEAAGSPPLFQDLDGARMTRLSKLNTNVIYVFGGAGDYTDEATAKKIVSIVRAKGKKGEYKIIPNAGHEVCCGGATLDIQYTFISGLMG